MSSDRKCGWCRHSVGTTSKAYVFCQQENMQVFRDSSLKCFDRAVGAEDNKGESDGD